MVIVLREKLFPKKIPFPQIDFRDWREVRAFLDAAVTNFLRKHFLLTPNAAAMEEAKANAAPTIVAIEMNFSLNVTGIKRLQDVGEVEEEEQEEEGSEQGKELAKFMIS